VSAKWHRRTAAEWVSLASTLILSAVARAQTVDLNGAAPFGLPINDQRVYAHAMLNEFEGRFGGPDSAFRWDGEAWVGTDTNRLWLKSEGFVANGIVSDGDHELLYDHPISPFFDIQAGLRYDRDSFASRSWAAVGLEGLAPYFFQFSATLYASDAGHFAAKVEVSYEELITQRLILEPLAELNAYTRSDSARGVASGLSDMDIGVRLRYEVSRKFAPYLGVAYERTYGPPVLEMAASQGLTDTARSGEWRFAVGLRTWW
jgi:copper resistance protein B